MYYVFAIIGMEAWGGNIYEGNHSVPGQLYDDQSAYALDLLTGNPKLVGTDYADTGYYANNFNNIVSAFVLLFELMVVNNWQILAEGFIATSSKAARIYFIVFHLIVVVVFLK